MLPTCFSYVRVFFPLPLSNCSQSKRALQLSLYSNYSDVFLGAPSLEKTPPQCKQWSYFIKVNKYHRVAVCYRIKLQRKQESERCVKNLLDERWEKQRSKGHTVFSRFYLTQYKNRQKADDYKKNKAYIEYMHNRMLLGKCYPIYQYPCVPLAIMEINVGNQWTFSFCINKCIILSPQVWCEKKSLHCWLSVSNAFVGKT